MTDLLRMRIICATTAHVAYITSEEFRSDGCISSAKSEYLLDIHVFILPNFVYKKVQRVGEALDFIMIIL